MDLSSAQGVLSRLQLQVGGITFMPWQVLAIVFLLFLLVITMASVRRHFLEWSIKGAGFGVVLGFILALIVEGFLLIGGRTALTEVLGWKNAPKPVQVAIDKGRERLVNVLGVTSEIPLSNAAEASGSSEIVSKFSLLSPDEVETVKAIICTPEQ